MRPGGVGRRSIGGGTMAALAALAVACGATTQPSPSTAGAVTPTASVRPASVRPSSAPSADPATVAIQEFVAFAADPDTSYQATFTGRSRHTTDILPITKGVLQVSGKDVLVRATFTFPDRHAFVVEHRLVGDKAWIRYSPDPWRRLAGFRAADSMAAFPAVRTAADVTYLGPKTVGGRTVYQVQVRSAVVNPVMIPATNLSETSVTSPKLVVLIDAAGRPVSGSAEITGRGRVSRQLQEIVIDLDLKFTKVGDAVTIKAP